MSTAAFTTALPRRLLATGGPALADQVLFAAAPLVLNVLLARWLVPAEYGAFATAFAVFLLAANLHTAVLTEPLLVHGAGARRGALRGYVRVLVLGHLVLSLALAGLLGVAALVLGVAGSDASAAALGGLAIGAPGILLLWLARRIFYVTGDRAVAAWGAAVQIVVLVAALAALASAGAVTPARGFAALGLAGLAGGATLLAVAWRRLPAGDAVTVGEVLRAHADYGRWAAAAQGLMWASSQAVIVLVPLVLGFEEAAVVAAVVNLFRPLHPVQQSAIAIVLPGASARAAAGEAAGAVGAGVRSVLLPLSLAIVGYGLLLAALAGPVMHHLYGGRYDDSRGVVLLVAAVYALATHVQARTVVLKATGNVAAVPSVFAASAAVTVALAVPAMLVAGVEGALLAVCAGYVAAGAVGARRVRRLVAA